MDERDDGAHLAQARAHISAQSCTRARERDARRRTIKINISTKRRRRRQERHSEARQEGYVRMTTKSSLHLN